MEMVSFWARSLLVRAPVMGDPAGVGVLADLDVLLVQDVHIHPDVVIGLSGHLGRMLFFPWPPA